MERAMEYQIKKVLDRNGYKLKKIRIKKNEEEANRRYIVQYRGKASMPTKIITEAELWELFEELFIIEY